MTTVESFLRKPQPHLLKEIQGWKKAIEKVERISAYASDFKLSTLHLPSFHQNTEETH